MPKLQCVLVSTVLCITGCASSPQTVGPYQSHSIEDRNPLRAQELTLQAADLMETDRARAELLLREALAADLHHGPAHNNLGVIHLERGEWYEAANEFEWARKLMPGHPDPRINLALVLESVGRTDEAMATYRRTLEVYPDHIAALQGLVRLQIRTGQTDELTRERLSEISLRGEYAMWRSWAEEELSRVRR